MWMIVIYLGLLASGYVVGAKFLRNSSINPKLLGNIIFATVILLVFLMGIRIGMDEQVVRGLGIIGAKAFALTLAAYAGSVLMVVIIRKCLKINRNGVE